MLEVNPRASRTVPFVSKVIGVPLAKVAARVMVGRTLARDGHARGRAARTSRVKEAVFPFVKFPGVDTLLGPEMRSTGEVMGIDRDFPVAFAKAQIGAGTRLPTDPKQGRRVHQRARRGQGRRCSRSPRGCVDLGFRIVATHGTARFFREPASPPTASTRSREGRPHCVDAIVNGEFSIVINTTVGAAGDQRLVQHPAHGADQGRAVLHDHRGGARGRRWPSRRSSAAHWTCARCKSTIRSFHGTGTKPWLIRRSR